MRFHPLKPLLCWQNRGPSDSLNSRLGLKIWMPRLKNSLIRIPFFVPRPNCFVLFLASLFVRRQKSSLKSPAKSSNPLINSLSTRGSRPKKINPVSLKARPLCAKSVTPSCAKPFSCRQRLPLAAANQSDSGPSRSNPVAQNSQSSPSAVPSCTNSSASSSASLKIKPLSILTSAPSLILLDTKDRISGLRAFRQAALSLIGQRPQRVFSLFSSRIQPNSQ